MESLGHAVVRRRIPIIITWILLLLAGGAAAGKLADRWFESFSIPGFSAYEANQRTLETFGTGEQAPLIAVLTDPKRDITTVDGVQKAIAAAAGGDAQAGACGLVVRDEELDVPVEGQAHDGGDDLPAGPVDILEPASDREGAGGARGGGTRGRHAAPDGTRCDLRLPGRRERARVLTETLLGALGALIILLFVFGTLPAVAMPLLMALTSILTTFLCIYGLTYVTDVSIIVQFLVALVGLGVSIDYALLMIFRFREELSHGETTEEAIAQTMAHAGRSVIVSGSTVAIGLVSMVLLPLPFIRSIGIGGMLIPAVAVLASITFLPAVLSYHRAGHQPRPRDAEALRRDARSRTPASGGGGPRSCCVAPARSSRSGSRSWSWS